MQRLALDSGSITDQVDGDLDAISDTANRLTGGSGWTRLARIRRPTAYSPRCVPPLSEVHSSSEASFSRLNQITVSQSPGLATRSSRSGPAFRLVRSLPKPSRTCALDTRRDRRASRAWERRWGERGGSAPGRFRGALHHAGGARGARVCNGRHGGWPARADSGGGIGRRGFGRQRRTVLIDRGI